MGNLAFGFGYYNTYNAYNTGSVIGPLIGAVIAGLIFGFAAKSIADSKGVPHGFAWGFWLGIIGLIVVACKKGQDQYNSGSYQSQQSSDYWNRISGTPADSATGSWTCVCGAKNPNSLSYCLSCRRTRTEAKTIKCPHCGANNRETNLTCFSCGRSLKEQPTGAGYNTTMSTYTPATPSYTPEQESASRPSISLSKASGAVDNSEETIALLNKLKALYDSGVLSEDEYKEKKRELLSRL